MMGYRAARIVADEAKRLFFNRPSSMQMRRCIFHWAR